MGWIFGVGLSLSILYHPTAVERNGHCADSGPCGALRAGEGMTGEERGRAAKEAAPGTRRKQGRRVEEDGARGMGPIMEAGGRPRGLD